MKQPYIQRTELRQFKVDAYCPACGLGKMVSTGVVLTTKPPCYPHACDRCEYTAVYDVHYPSLEYQEV